VPILSLARNFEVFNFMAAGVQSHGRDRSTTVAIFKERMAAVRRHGGDRRRYKK
jgi:hypothetical protein